MVGCLSLIGPKHVSVYDIEGNIKYQFPAKSPDNVSSDTQDTQLWSLAIDSKNNLLVGESNLKYISKHCLDGKHVMSFNVTIQPKYIAVSSQNKSIISAMTARQFMSSMKTVFFFILLNHHHHDPAQYVLYI